MIPPPLEHYLALGAALFPLPAGQKNPTGIIGSFAHDWSRDPAQVERWANENPGCNWGMVAGPSGMIVADIDVKDVGRDAAWAAWCTLCADWGLPEVLRPHVETPSRGWHVYFKVPANVDARSLRQPDAIKGLINLRAGNGYVLIPPSRVDGASYAHL